MQVNSGVGPSGPTGASTVRNEPMPMLAAGCLRKAYR